SEGMEPFFCSDGDKAVETFRQVRPDVVLLDVMLPGRDGIQICHDIRAESGVPIVMLTARTDTVDVVIALETGADDYITKPYSARELLARMKAVLRRSGLTPQQEGILRAGPVELDQDRHMARVRGEVVHLTPKEFALLALLIGQTGRVLSRTSLMRQLWDEEADTKTLDVHIKRLRAKIEIDPANPQFIVTIRGLGYRFISDRIAAATG
ncbi:MAG: winged helix-turn-helix domain-containing protein, partial [Actinomycetales bacterium]